MFESDKLNASGWGESRPDWDEALIETEWSLFLENAHESVAKTVVSFLS